VRAGKVLAAPAAAHPFTGRGGAYVDQQMGDFKPTTLDLTGSVEANARAYDDDDSDYDGPGITDYADPACPHCHGVGLITVDQATGRSTLCRCVMAGRQKAAASARIEMLFGKGGAKMTLNSYDPGDIPDNQTALEVAKNYVRNWDAFREAGAGFALQGQPGSGKTHVATGVCIALIWKTAMEGRMIKPFTLSVPEMLRLARRKFDDPSTADVLDQAMNADLYLLDDIGAEYHRQGTSDGMSWVDEQLFMILNHRLTNQLPTIYTTNLNRRALEERVDQRVWRRLNTATLTFRHMEVVPRAVAKPAGLTNLLMNGS